jgi:lysophospholipase L1-like esterase
MPQRLARKYRHPWRLKLAAIGFGFLPLLFSELILVVLDLPKRTTAIDPFVDLHHLRPLFELDEKSGNLAIGSERLHLFRPVSFPARKPEGTFRVFALGGSTTQGEPYSTETAFPEWLKLNLTAQSRETCFEVINCGGLSYASYRVLAILREVLEYDPDLIVIYTGQNEFLEQRTYSKLKPTGGGSSVVAWLAEMRTVRLARNLVTKPAARDDAASQTELAAEVDALLDYSGGLSDYRRDDPWREPVVDHFRWNVERMIQACQQRHVPLILVRPVSNLIDCPPFKMEIDSKLPGGKQAEFMERWAALCEKRDVIADPLREVNELLAIDPQHAGALYLKARMLADQGDWDSAKRFFVAARDADVCPLRAITPIVDTVTELAELFEVPLVNAENLISSRSEHQLPGSHWLVDHVHPTIEGHQLIGEALAELCVQEHIATPTASNWRTTRKELYAEHLRGLGEAYFHRGKQRLEGLMLWTQGRAKKMKTNAYRPAN